MGTSSAPTIGFTVLGALGTFFLNKVENSDMSALLEVLFALLAHGPQPTSMSHTIASNPPHIKRLIGMINN